MSGAISRLAAACSGTDPTDSIQAALQALPGLGLSVAALNPFGSSQWGYNLTSFLIQVQRALYRVHLPYDRALLNLSCTLKDFQIVLQDALQGQEQMLYAALKQFAAKGVTSPPLDNAFALELLQGYAPCMPSKTSHCSGLHHFSEEPLDLIF